MLPELIAHRGLHDVAPENTVEAFARALDAGADAVELDVHATKDRIVVVHHDPVITDTANHHLRGVPIAELLSERVIVVEPGGTRIPRLEDVLRLLRGRALAYVEVKGRNIEELVLRVVRESGAACALHSFDHAAIGRLAVLAPEIPRGILEEDRAADPAAVLALVGARDLWQHVSTVDHELVERVHAAGGRVVAWTANRADEWERLLQAGVDAICTDDVLGLKAFLDLRAQHPRGG